jgi:type II secretory pathway component GspD/PulD (secretin)
MFPVRVFAVFTLLAGIWLAAGVAAPVSSDDKPKSEFPAERIKKALDQNISINQEQVSWQNVLDVIKEQTKINIVVDQSTLNQYGITGDHPTISVNLKDVKARKAIQSAISQLHLSYAVVGDHVFISFEENCLARQFRQKVSIEVKDVAIKAVLHNLSRETGVNILLDPRLKTEAENPVSLQLDDATFDAAVRLLAELAGLKPVRIGSLVFVTSEARADKLKDDNELLKFNPQGQPTIIDRVIGGGFAGGIGGVMPAFPFPGGAPGNPAPDDQDKDKK